MANDRWCDREAAPLREGAGETCFADGFGGYRLGPAGTVDNNFGFLLFFAGVRAI